MAIKNNPFKARNTQDNGNSNVSPTNTPTNTEANDSSRRERSERTPAPAERVFSGKKQDVFSALSSETDEETAISQKKETKWGTRSAPKNDNAIRTAEAIIEESKKQLANKYTEGGIKAARYITFDKLQEIGKIDPDFFKRYEDASLEASSVVLNTIIDSSSSEIADAQENPIDEIKQDKAYRILYSAMYEYFQTHHKELNRTVLMGMITNEILGFGPLDPLWRDRKIDEILCNGPHDIQVEVKGQIHRVPAARFRDREHLYKLLEKLFGSINKQVSQMTPIVDGRLHDNSRMAVTHHVIAPTGPNFSIRRHPESYWTPQKTIDYGAANEAMMKDLGNLINKGCSFLVIGGTSTGKTSTLNALSGFFNPEERIITLEDNLEMMLNPNKLLAAPMETIPPKPDRPKDTGVTMRDLLRATLRLRPDGIIIGEVRDGAAYDLVQALNTGHWGASTIHANSAEDGIYRVASLVAQSGLSTLEGALPLIAAAFDFVILLKHYPSDGSRKIVSVNEIATKPTLGADGEPYLPVTPMWEFKEAPNTNFEDLTVKGEWKKLGDISDIRSERRSLHLTPDKNWEQLLELSKV